MEFEPNHYQKQAISHIKNPDAGHAVVSAVPGSGKTTLLRMIAHELWAEGLFLAFNRHIKEELEQKLKHTPMEVRTVHSVGMGMLYSLLSQSNKKPNVDGKKYWDICKDYTEGWQMKWQERQKAISNLVNITSLVRLNLLDPENNHAIRDLCDHHGIVMEDYFKHVPGIIAYGNRMAEQTGVIDFDDMVYLPVQWELDAPQYKYVLVDEAQDLNKAQAQIALRCMADGGKFMAVGDPRQAIYGFAGADARSFENLREATNAKKLPLSICYRCPKSVVELAQEIEPQITARENAPQGTVRDLPSEDLLDEVDHGDLILCRLNAPLISTCISLIRNRVHARIKGRDIAKMLKKTLRKISEYDGFAYDQFPGFVNKWRQDKITYMTKKEASEAAIQTVRDTAESLLVLGEEFAECKSIACLTREIDTIFDDTRPAVWLSTVHKAKGLENERVFIIEPDKLPLIWKDQLEWQYQQEINLRYVAITRAQEELIFVR